MTELRECPMCGDTEPGYARHGQRHSVKCTIAPCQTDGPWMLTKAAAISAWNRRADDWQPIETAPRDGTEVMLWDGYWRVPMYWSSKAEEWTDGDIIIPSEYTYWRPLPKGPGE
jgi:hypothetical protein